MRSRAYPRYPFADLTPDALAFPQPSLLRAVATVAKRTPRCVYRLLLIGITSARLRLADRARRLAGQCYAETPHGTSEAGDAWMVWRATKVAYNDAREAYRRAVSLKV